MPFASLGQAAVEPIAASAFSGSSSISFDGLATGTEANGLVVGGLSFGVIVAGVFANGQVIVDAGFSQTPTLFAVDNFLFGQSRVRENSSTFDVLAIAFVVLTVLRTHWSTLSHG